MTHKHTAGVQQVVQLEVGGLEGHEVVGAAQRVKVTCVWVWVWGGGNREGRQEQQQQQQLSTVVSICQGEQADFLPPPLSVYSGQGFVGLGVSWTYCVSTW